jgi:hypothetical protein
MYMYLMVVKLVLTLFEHHSGSNEYQLTPKVPNCQLLLVRDLIRYKYLSSSYAINFRSRKVQEASMVQLVRAAKHEVWGCWKQI